MKWIERQKRVEQETYQTIEDLADEIGLEIPFYPEVYWVGRLNYEDFALKGDYRELFYDCHRMKKSYYLALPKIIMINDFRNQEHIAEESAHFLHFVNSKIRFSKRPLKNFICLKILIEMLGYFGSKLIVPDRKDRAYAQFEDLVSLKKEKKKNIRKLNQMSRQEKTSILIYNQGYGLGERLFNSYVVGQTSIEEIRKLFLKDFKQPYSALAEFIILKQRYWND